MITFRIKTEDDQAMLMRAFKEWGKKHKVYGRFYKKLTPKCFEIVKGAFKGMGMAKPGMYDLWWATHHAYFRPYRQDEVKPLHEVFHTFLTDVSYERVKLQPIKKDTQKRAAKTGTE